MDKKLENLIQDLDKVMTLIRKINEATDEKDVDSLKKEIKLTRDELKSKYGQTNPPQTDSSEA